MSDLPNLANRDYVARVNRAIDHIIQNLGEPLRLEAVASVACFSPYHFHRIFQGLVGETLAAFIKRVRLERAVYLLSFHDGKSLTEIALACGFSSSSDFSRCFRGHYGVPPRLFDTETFRRGKREEMLSKLPAEEGHLLQPLAPGENPDGFVVRLREYPARKVAYLRVSRPFEPGRVTTAAARLLDWALQRGLEGGQWLGYMWDVPEIASLEHCRYDVGVEVSGAIATDDEVATIEFPAMTVAELEIAGPIELEQRAIDWLYATWLPQSGYAPDDQPAFEAWNGLPFAHGEAHFELRVQLPVVDASLPL